MVRMARGLPWWLSGKDSIWNLRVTGSISGSGRSTGEANGYTPQYSYLENSMDRGAWQAGVRGVAKGLTWLSDSTTATRVDRSCPASARALVPTKPCCSLTLKWIVSCLCHPAPASITHSNSLPGFYRHWHLRAPFQSGVGRHCKQEQKHGEGADQGMSA